LVVIAASQGGVTALKSIFAALPADFPVPIAVVLHRAQSPSSRLADVLGREPHRVHAVRRQSIVPIRGLQAVSHVLPLEQIPRQLVGLVG
jgi:two-component system chemotaxis response regulator CheB